MLFYTVLTAENVHICLTYAKLLYIIKMLFWDSTRRNDSNNVYLIKGLCKGGASV